MWSYYANNHQGFCIEFPFDEKQAKQRIPIEKIRYSNTRFDIQGLNPERMRITSPRRLGVVIPSQEITDEANNIDILELTRKSRAWRHEQEWRFIWSENYERPAEMLIQDRAAYGQKAEHKAHLSRPSRVILGANMCAKTKITLTNLLKKIGIPIVEARLSKNACRIEYNTGK